MRLGRDGAHAQQAVVRRQSRWPRSLFFAFIIFVVGAVLILVQMPDEQFEAWFGEGTHAIEISNTPHPKAKISSSDIAIPNLDSLGKQEKVFDPVQRDRWLARINQAADKDRKTNIAAASKAMEADLADINARIEKLTAFRSANEDEAAKKDKALTAFQKQAAQVAERFEKRSIEIDRSIEAERNRRDAILRGLQ